MLKINKISKSYTTAGFTQKALDEVSIDFRQNEFVSILGASGSGKTTLLNIIGGLDRYDSGDIICNDRSTKDFSDKDWDAYRNNCIGFIFQSYNLIGHISVLENVEMGMTLSGVSKKDKRAKALSVLEKVGIKEHANKKPNQLSGGQMQRVAIARALANDPEIILADEPTGALDSATSVAIMELIKEIAQDKLVIMVTHNPELAKEYSSRIIEIKDGQLVHDSNPTKEGESSKHYNIKKTAMSFKTALQLSFNNIKTKKGRTLLTSFAASIGIIGISLILSLSNGFNLQIDKFERETFGNFPVMIPYGIPDMEAMMNTDAETANDYLLAVNAEQDLISHINNITPDYIEFIEKVDPNLADAYSAPALSGLNLVNKETKDIVNSSALGLSISAKSLDEKNFSKYLETNYTVVEGRYPENMYEIALYVDKDNRISDTTLSALGVNLDDNKVEYNEVIGKEFLLIDNDDFYKQYGNVFGLNSDLDQMINSKETMTIKIVGIIKVTAESGNASAMVTTSTSTGIGGVFYSYELYEKVLKNGFESQLGQTQQKVDYNVLTGKKFGDTVEKYTTMIFMGLTECPSQLMIYPKDFESKDELLAYLDTYNEGKEEAQQIVYMDMASTIIDMSGNIMNAITYVLIAFSSIALFVSSIMIGIITYISVLERTKEIGILRALGARKKDITRVFKAETFLIGLFSGLLGIGITYALTLPINSIIYSLTELENVAILNPVAAFVMVLISILVTMLGGIIPSKLAAKKDPVESLRSE